jgi:hypothetical protein
MTVMMGCMWMEQQMLIHSSRMMTVTLAQGLVIVTLPQRIVMMILTQGLVMLARLRRMMTLV